MYTCPECGSHDVTVRRLVRSVEHWRGEDFDVEQDLSAERGPDSGSMECDECGGEFIGDLSEVWEG